MDRLTEDPGAVKRRRPGVSYVLMPLAPPIIWITYFMGVYLYAEAGCQFGWEEPAWFGLHGVSVITILATIAALGVLAYYTMRSWRQFRHPDETGEEQMSRSLAILGVLSGVIFIVATLSLGLPALLLAPC